MAYFIIRNKKKEGPFSFEEIRDMKLFNDVLVWKEGLKEWKPAKEIEELKSITFAEPPPVPKNPASAEEIIKTIGIHLFFGFGFYYVDKSVKRKIIYPIFGFYAWFSYFNVFLKVSKPIADFHNHTMFGACSIFIAWGITYLAGFTDLFIHVYKVNKLNRSII